VSLPGTYRNQFHDYLTTDHGNRLVISIFSKSLYVFLLLKVFLFWGTLHKIESHWDSFLFGHQALDIFLTVMSVALLSGLILPINYISSILIFLFSFLLSRSAFPVINGSDLVLNLFLFLSIFLCVRPAPPQFQLVISNAAFLLCRMQLGLIYFLSGFDKLMSDAWRSGGAVFSISNLEFFLNPNLHASPGRVLCFLIAWLIILFELSFGLLIWLKKFRWVMLGIGIFFHLIIIFVLSLPDFGVVMLLTYILFIPFSGKKEPTIQKVVMKTPVKKKRTLRQ
jgi:hypothetical protein